jgi:hypothetical protein
MFCSKGEVISYAMCVMFVGSMMMDNFMQKSLLSSFSLRFRISAGSIYIGQMAEKRILYLD